MIRLSGFDEFDKKCEDIKSLTRQKNPDAIIDGIINTQKYFNIPTDKPRILWILKEANTQVLGWEYQDLLSSAQLANTKNFNIQSIRRVLYSSYSLLNGFISYKDIPTVSNSEVYSIADNIAYINVNKDPGGGATSIYNQLFQNSKKYTEIVQMQIELYAPDIIILGNTKEFLSTNFFNEDIKTYSDLDTHNTAIYEYGDKLILYAYHPGARIDEATYCDEIISASKKWWLNKLDKKS